MQRFDIHGTPEAWRHQASQFTILGPWLRALAKARRLVEAVKKSTIPVILSAAKNLQLFVFKKINADASLSMTAHFFTALYGWEVTAPSGRTHCDGHSGGGMRLTQAVSGAWAHKHPAVENVPHGARQFARRLDFGDVSAGARRT